MANRDLVTGIVLGVAAAALTPVILRSMGVRAEPLGTAAKRASLMLSGKFNEVVAEVGEIAEDTMAEMRAISTQDARTSDSPTSADSGGGDGSGSETA